MRLKQKNGHNMQILTKPDNVQLQRLVDKRLFLLYGLKHFIQKQFLSLYTLSKY